MAIVVVLASALTGAAAADAAVGQGGFSWAGSVAGPSANPNQGPSSVSASSARDRILVSDEPKNALMSLAGNGALIPPFSSPNQDFTGDGTYSFNLPWQATENGSEVDVSDIGSGKVLRISLSNGSSLGAFTSAPTGFDPRGIARNPSDGDIAVADVGNNQVDIFSATGSYVKAYTTSSPSLAGPTGVAFDANGNLFIADENNNRVVELDGNGTAVRSFAATGSQDTQLNRPTAVSVDAFGNVWVTDPTNNSVEQFDATGHLLAVISTANGSADTLSAPNGVAVNPLNGDLWVADTFNNRIVRYTIPAPTATTDAATNVTTTVATLNGTVGPAYGPTSCHFDYRVIGSGNAGIHSTNTVSDCSSGQNSSQSADASLQSGQSYEFRFVVSRPDGSGLADGDWTAVGSPTPPPGLPGSFSFKSSFTPRPAPANSHPSGPVGVSAGNGLITVADSPNNAMASYGSSDQALAPFSSQSSSESTGNGFSFSNPLQAVLDGTTAQVLVVDEGNKQVLRLNPSDGSKLGTLPVGSTLTHFDPWGIARAPNGDIAVADPGDGVIAIWTPQLNGPNPADVFSTTYNTSAPTLSNPEGVSFDSNGNLFIADTGNQRVVELDASGDFVQAWGVDGFPTGIAADTFGNVWVAVPSKNQVEWFDSTGHSLGIVASATGTSDPLAVPQSVAVNDRNGDLYVADTGNDRIVHYTPGGPTAHTDPATNVTSSGAKLHGTVDSNDGPWLCHFEYKLSTDPNTNYAPVGGPNDPSPCEGGNYSPSTDFSVSSPGKYDFRLVAYRPDHSDPSVADPQQFQTTGSSATPPTVTTEPVFSKSSTGLVLKGHVNPNGTDTLWSFRYGSSPTSMPNIVPDPAGTDAGSGTTSKQVIANTGTLTPGQTVYYQLYASAGGTTTYGDILSATTPRPPIPVIDGVISRATHELVLKAEINPEGQATTYYIRYSVKNGVNNSYYPSQSGTAFTPQGTTSQVIDPSPDIRSLAPNTEYCFYLVATNAAGSSDSDPLCTPTSADTTAPAVATSAPFPKDLSPKSINMSGTVNPNGAPTTWFFQISSQPDLSGAVSWSTNSSNPHGPASLGNTGTSPVNVSVTATGLTAGTTYYYRLVATDTNNGNTVYSDGPTHAQSVTAQTPAEDLSADVRYLGADNQWHSFALGSPTFDAGDGGGIPMGFTCAWDSKPDRIGIGGCDIEVFLVLPKGDKQVIAPTSANNPSIPNLPSDCKGPSACQYKINVYLGDFYGKQVTVTYHYTVNAPPLPAVQVKIDQQASNAINQQLQPQRAGGLLGFLQGIGNTIVSGWNTATAAVRSAVAAAENFLGTQASRLKNWVGTYVVTTLTQGSRTLPIQIGFDHDGNRYLIAPPGYTIIAAGGGNASDRGIRALSPYPALTARGLTPKYLVIDSHGNPAGIIAAGGGNLSVWDAIIAAGGGNILSGLWVTLVNGSLAKIIAAGGGNIVSAGGGNIVSAGGGNAADRVRAAASNRVRMGKATVQSFLKVTAKAGTTVTSTLRVAPVHGRRTGRAVALASGRASFLVTGKQSLRLVSAAAGQSLMSATAAQNAKRARTHKRLLHLRVTVVDTFKRKGSPTRSYSRSYTITPLKR